MRFLISSSTNRWKAAEIQLHSSTQARVLTHLKCLVLRDRGYSQEFRSLGQDAVGSSMCCPSLFFHLYLSLTSPFILSFQGSCLPRWSWLPFPEYWGVPFLAKSEDRKLQAHLAPVPSLGTGGQGVMADGPRELEVMEKQLVFDGRVVSAPCSVSRCLGSALQWRNNFFG